MAKLTEIIVAVEAEGVNEVLTALGNIEGAQTQLANKTKQSADDQKGATGGIKESWTQMATGINQAMGIARTAINAGKAVYDFTHEGAQLDYVAGKFDNLTASIGTNSFALMNDLRNATQGTMSDAELMKSATDMMSLGLTNTHDETVRLTNVAGELGMNMDQLTLTLTNQTTKRFDTLGVSVAGFEEKFEALKASGMGVQEAFTEAFLQQAEGQIARVGGIAETSVGSLMKLEAAFEQIGANAKQNLADMLVPSVDEAATGLARLAEIGTQNRGLADLAEQMEQAGLDTEGFWGEVKELQNVWGNLSTEDYTAIVEKYGTKIDSAAEGTQKWADANYEGEEAQRQANAAIESGIAEMEEFTLANTEAALAVGLMSAVYDELALDFGAMQSMAYGYDEQLNLIAETERQLEQLRPFAETGGTLNGVKMSAEEVKQAIADLEGVSESASEAMDRMAKEMTLSLMQASMEVDGYTESEIDALTQYMVDAGLISAEAAEKMKQDYMTAINTANAIELEQKVGEILANVEGYEEGVELVDGKLIDSKTGEILADTTDFLDGMTEADLAELDPKIAEILADIMPYLRELANLPDPEPKEVEITAVYYDTPFKPNVPSSINVGVNYIPNNAIPKALGGAVYPGQQYLWQEPGREGELFIPETYGRVMNQHEVAMALREALRPDYDRDYRDKRGGYYKQPDPRKNVSVVVNATIANDFDLDKLTREIVRRINL